MTEQVRPDRFRTDLPDLLTITAASTLNTTLGAYMSNTATALDTTQPWPLAKQVIYMPFVTNRPFTVRTIGWQNGTSPTGNIEVGIYSDTGVRLGTSTSTAAGTSAALQKVNPTAFTLPGSSRFYFAVTCSAITYTLDTVTGTHGAGTYGMLGFMTETTVSFGLTDPWGAVAVLTGDDSTHSYAANVFISASTTT